MSSHCWRQFTSFYNGRPRGSERRAHSKLPTDTEPRIKPRSLTTAPYWTPGGREGDSVAQTTGSAQERGTAGSQCKWPFVFLPRNCLQSPSYSVIYVDACISQSCPGGLNLSWCSSQSFQLEERLSQGGADLGSAGAALHERLPQLAPA